MTQVALRTTTVQHPFVPPNPIAPAVRAALVNPPDPNADGGLRLTSPLGLGYIASAARLRGFGADVFDLAGFTPGDIDSLAATGLLDGYDVYGFGSYTQTLPMTIEIISAVRAARPQALIVMGGYHATPLWQQALDDLPDIDLVVVNEGEEPFASILERLVVGEDFTGIPGVACRIGTVPTLCPASETLVEQDSLPYPVAGDAIVHRSAPYLDFVHARSGRIRRTVPIVSSRGCPKRCSFCSIIVMSPKWRARSVESLMAEIRYRYEQEPFDHVMFQDANFFVRSRRTLEFARALHRFNPAMTWSGTATADHIVKHGDVIVEIGNLNCAYMEVGIEAGNDGSLKRFNKWTTVETNRAALALLASAHIPIGLDFIMFEPDMSLAEVRDNIDFLIENDLAGYWPSDTVFSELQLFPATRARDEYEARIGTTLPVHSLIAPEFADPAVSGLARAMGQYYAIVQSQTDELIRDLQTEVNDILYGTGDRPSGAAAAIIVQQAQACIVRLRHLSYRWIDLAARCADPLLAAEPYVALVESIGLDAERATHADGLAHLNSLRRLKGIAA